MAGTETMSVKCKKDPGREARALLEECGVRRAPTPLDKIAQHLKAQIRYSSMDDELSGMAYIKNGIPIIGVNALHAPVRQRFTIAHEIAHIRLHPELITEKIHVDKGIKMLMRDPKAAAGVDDIEIDANAFAAELLMPEALVKAALQERNINIENDEEIAALAKKFKVSIQAMTLRLGRLFRELS
jgi:Zn-dependent peptidase ImmA (M78 family)